MVAAAARQWRRWCGDGGGSTAVAGSVAIGVSRSAAAAGGGDDNNNKNESNSGGGDSGGNMLELSQMGVSKRAHYLKFPLVTECPECQDTLTYLLQTPNRDSHIT